ncbi:DUF3368 domain-containing protein [Candidatus Poribacteria bacterium]|nr:MAG: DUF3368 domain-containing protein [Candidatus Poribacteria bacterium]
MQEKPPVISNNGPLVALWTLDLLFLLRELYTEVLIPEEVQDEFFATERPVRSEALKNAPWIRVVTLTPPLDHTTYPNVIHRGEAAVFALAKERGARLVILDDKDARGYAKRIGLPVTGMVGIWLHRCHQAAFRHTIEERRTSRSITCE